MDASVGCAKGKRACVVTGELHDWSVAEVKAVAKAQAQCASRRSTGADRVEGGSVGMRRHNSRG